MKKILLSLLLITCVQIVLAQTTACVPGTLTSPNAGYIIPDSATNFVHGCAGKYYEQIIYIKAPKDTTVYVGSVPFNANVDSFVVNSNLAGLPSYLSLVTTPGLTPASGGPAVNNFDRLIIKGDSLACVKIYGNVPAAEPAGVNNLTISIRAYLTIPLIATSIDTPANVTYYNITIDAPGTGACIPAATNDFKKITISNVTLSPNPANDITTLKFFSNRKEEYNFSMVNLMGEVVWNVSTTVGLGENAISIPTSAMAEGMYLIKINNAYTAFGMKLLLNR